jgi:hypothetical protein
MFFSTNQVFLSKFNPLKANYLGYKGCFFATFLKKGIKQKKNTFNKPSFLFFATGTTCRTFVSSMTTNGGETERSGKH